MRSIRFLYGGNMRKYITENIAAIQFNDLISVSLVLYLLSRARVNRSSAFSVSADLTGF